MSVQGSAAKKLPDASAVMPKKLAHLVLKTSNYEAMVDWYIKVLNARVALAAPHLSFLTYDDEHHRLAICKVPRLAKHNPNACGLEHVAFTYGDLGDLLATYKRLKALGINPRWPINHGMTTSFYYDDPDGNRVELQVDHFPTAAETQHFFETDPDIAANPLGAEFDPEQLIAQYEAGVPLEKLIKVPAVKRSPFEILEEMGLGQNNV
jgi:catechol-2,3-dioxygenase